MLLHPPGNMCVSIFGTEMDRPPNVGCLDTATSDQELDDVDMAVVRGILERLRRASLGPIRVQPANHIQMAIAGRVVHRMGRTSLVAMAVQPLHHCQVPLLRCNVHGVAAAAFWAMGVEPFDHIHVALTRRAVHGLRAIRFHPMHVQPLDNVQVVVLGCKDPRIRRARAAVRVKPFQHGQMAIRGGQVHRERGQLEVGAVLQDEEVAEGGRSDAVGPVRELRPGWERIDVMEKISVPKDCKEAMRHGGVAESSQVALVPR
ncbi:Aste57867_18874 [Aphanomyces stellatus]|uniref:Aste57867_18874 protein n=1 Tax=Aphanomyces stellatus TaxID=120398 RepID=A0A485LBU3_9STRA|nr:hypothetical protein As57867_018810 [Aphanomyces stellatus]VFT95608.1 Aste57867_18874 [Aphanomyces stellatus]